MGLSDFFLGGGGHGLSRSRIVDDFTKWYEGTEPPQHEHYDEAVPPGVDGLVPRYGTFASTAKGVPKAARGDLVPVCGGERSPSPAPLPPCATKNECLDLLRLARRLQHGSAEANEALKAAVTALEAAKVLGTRAQLGADNMLKAMPLRQLAAGDDEGEMTVVLPADFALKKLLGPLEDDDLVGGDILRPKGDTTFLLPRLTARWERDQRVAEYLRRAENQEPLQLPLGRVGVAPGIGPVEPPRWPLRIWPPDLANFIDGLEHNEFTSHTGIPFAYEPDTDYFTGWRMRMAGPKGPAPPKLPDFDAAYKAFDFAKAPTPAVAAAGLPAGASLAVMLPRTCVPPAATPRPRARRDSTWRVFLGLAA